MATLGESAGNWFDVIVATPGGIENAKKQGASETSRLLIVNEYYSWKEIYCKLKEMVIGCERETWDESLNCLRKKFIWEYEGMYGYR